MIFAVLDPSPLTVCINCSFFTFVGVSFTTFTQCAPEATEFGKITQNKSHCAVQGHLGSPILVPIEAHTRLPISD